LNLIKTRNISNQPWTSKSLERPARWRPFNYSLF
jgi:hypothetical protein